MTPGYIRSKDDELGCDTASITSRYVACERSTGGRSRCTAARWLRYCADSGESVAETRAWICALQCVAMQHEVTRLGFANLVGFDARARASRWGRCLLHDRRYATICG